MPIFKKPQKSSPEQLPAAASGHSLLVVLKIALIIFAVENLVMAGLLILDIPNRPIETLIDAILLICISSPIIYYWVIRPYIEARTYAEDKSAALQESEERWKFALEGGGDGVWDWDIATGRVFLSDRCQQVLGITDGNLQTHLSQWESTIHPEDLPRLTAELQAYFDGKTTAYSNEHRVRLKDGSWRWILTRGKVVSRDSNDQPLRMIGTQTDVTERKEAEASMQLASLVYQNSSEAMLVCDASGTIITVNPAFTEQTGYTPEDAIGKTPRILKSGRHDQTFYEAMWHALTTDGYWHGEVWNRNKKGELFAELLTINTIFNKDGTAQRWVALFHDITGQKKSEELIWTQANYDRLTGLANRSLFFDRLSKSLSQARRGNKGVALLFLDLDGFKAVNDTYGHEAGDAVLKTVAKRWQACVREMDTIARLGGDEFAMIVGELDNHLEATPIAEKLINALTLPIPLSDGQACTIGASIGISIFPDNATEMDSLLAAADTAMYTSKTRGKNTYTFADTTPGIKENAENWIVFDDTHLVGVAEIDSQHRQLIHLVNQLNLAITNNSSEIKPLFDKLVEFTLFHFSTEHQLMMQYHYPEISWHEQEHERLVAEVQRILEELHQGSELLALQSIKDWLMNHIVNSDKPLGDFLRTQGAS